MTDNIYIQTENNDKLKEECGVFGGYDFDGHDVASTIYYGLLALQHRGQESCGIAVSDTNGPKGKVLSSKDMGLVNEAFTPELAKKAVYGYVSIDSIAGPSEILVLADETATPRYVAADLLSQAEHDELASAILITTSKELAEKVSEEVDGFVKVLERAPIIQKSLDNYGYILLADNMEDAIDAANAIASEHLEIITKNPFDTMTRIRNAGAIFLGEYASEPLGDYFAGPNHILPTNGTARFFSPVNVDDFIKKTSIISYSRQALEKVHSQIETFAKSEGLTAHANSIKVRFED